VNQLSFGQSKKQLSYFAFRAGYLQTKIDLTSSRSNTYLGGIANRNSFYGGVFYHNNVTRFLAYRIELNYQQKGVENQDFSGNVLFQRRFHYVGVTPLVGITPITGLGLYIGPEANVRLGRVPLGRSENPIEVGISSRVAYRYKWIGVEVGYFKAFNKFTSIELGPDLQFGMKNRTWQAGLFFTPNLVKK
jgi:hypothetical protein